MWVNLQTYCLLRLIDEKIVNKYDKYALINVNKQFDDYVSLAQKTKALFYNTGPIYCLHRGYFYIVQYCIKQWKEILLQAEWLLFQYIIYHERLDIFPYFFDLCNKPGYILEMAIDNKYVEMVRYFIKNELDMCKDYDQEIIQILLYYK